MLVRLGKYRKPLFLLMLIAYFSSTFQQPVYQAIHLISHLTDIVHSNYDHHIHHHQSKLDHDHPLLSALDNDQNQKDIPTPLEQETKKKVELAIQSYEINLHTKFHKTGAFLYLMAFSQSENENPSPPPELV